MNETVELNLNNIVEILNQAIYESETAIDHPEKGYPYACGYSRAAMKNVLDKVQFLKSYLENESN
jgi:hypothetical protein